MQAAATRKRRTTARAASMRLPAYHTSFIGRAGDLQGILSLVAGSRLITLTGPGGAGKTRLATELGRTLSTLWPDGVWWVELVPITDPAQMPWAVVGALELPRGGSAVDTVAAWLAPRNALLVLDNCEHLVAACAEFCQAVLERCSRLTILATSREPMGVSGEARWPVSPLAAPAARELFEARAQLALPNFKVTETNARTVAEICERL